MIFHCYACHVMSFLLYICLFRLMISFSYRHSKATNSQVLLLSSMSSTLLRSLWLILGPDILMKGRLSLLLILLIDHLVLVLSVGSGTCYFELRVLEVFEVL